jgi:hypothetical protein
MIVSVPVGAFCLCQDHIVMRHERPLDIVLKAVDEGAVHAWPAGS